MSDAVQDISALDFAEELGIAARHARRVGGAGGAETRPALAWQFGPGAKGFRPPRSLPATALLTLARSPSASSTARCSWSCSTMSR